MNQHEESQIREVVIEVLRDLIVASSKKSSSVLPDKWVDLRKAWEILGYPSYQALYKAVKSGLLRPGIEVRDRRKPGARIARWQVNLAAAHKRLKSDPATRRAV